MVFNGWRNFATWAINDEFKPKTAEDVENARAEYDRLVSSLPDWLQVFVDDDIDWDLLADGLPSVADADADADRLLSDADPDEASRTLAEQQASMAISEMMKTLINEAIKAGNLEALNYIEDRMEVEIEYVPVLVNKTWAQEKREELRVALEAARIEITRENATPFGAVYATLDDAIQHMKAAQAAYAVLVRMKPVARLSLLSTDAHKSYWKQLGEIEQAHDAVTRAIALLKDIERTAEEAN